MQNKHLFLFLSYGLLFLIASCSYPKNAADIAPLTTPTSSTSVIQDTIPFPQSWEGKWTGTLEVFNLLGKQRELPMELHILPMDTSENHTFHIIYGEDKVEGLRPYELVTVNPDKGMYAIDEKNSIQMEAYLIDNTLLQRFDVEGTMLLTSTEKRGDKLVWSIISGPLKVMSTTGNETVDDEEIPEVKAYPLVVMQKAILTKK